jgi:hypothetical protein
MVLAEPDLGRPAPLCTGWAKNAYRLHGYRSIHHQEQKHILKGINMKTNQNNNQKYSNKLRIVKTYDINGLGKDILINVIDKVDEEPLKTNKPIEVTALNNEIILSFVNCKETPEMIEVNMTREEIKCLYDDLGQVYDVAFPE